MKERYTKTKWVDGKTCVNAANLNKIESGIENLYRNAVGESQLHGKDGIDITKDTDTGNITIGLAAENDMVRSSAVGRIEVVERMPADPDPMCMYFVKDYDTGKFDLVFGGTNLLSTTSTAEVPLAELTGEVEVVDNGDGTFTVSYDGEETGVEVIVYLNNVPVEFEEDWVLVPGENTIEVHIRKDGYEEMIVECDPIIYTPTTPAPEITYNEETYTVTVTGQGEVKLYVDGVEVELDENGSYTFERGEEAVPHVLTATAQGEDYAISETVEYPTITVPSLPELEGSLTIEEDPLYSGHLIITYTGPTEVEIVVEGEGFEDYIAPEPLPIPVDDPSRSGLRSVREVTTTREIQLTGELGPHDFTIIISAEGYKTSFYAESYTWRNKLEVPIITYTSLSDTNGEGVTVVITSNEVCLIHATVAVTNSRTGATIPYTLTGWNTDNVSKKIYKTYDEQTISVSAYCESTAEYIYSSDTTTENTSYTLSAKPQEMSDGVSFSIENYSETQVRLRIDVEDSTAPQEVTDPYYIILREVTGEEEDNYNWLATFNRGTGPFYYTYNRPAFGEENVILEAGSICAIVSNEWDPGRFIDNQCYLEENLTIPAQQESIPAAFNITARDEAYLIDFTGNVTSVYLDVNSVQVPYTVTRGNENQTLTFRVTTKDEFCLAKEVELTIIVPQIMTTPTPTISSEEDGDTVVVTATGEGNITLSIVGGEIVENPYTIEKTDQPQTITFMAVAKEEGKLISNATTLEVTIPAIEFKLEVSYQYYFNDAENIDERFDLTNNLTIGEYRDLVIEVSYITNDPGITEEITLTPSNTSSTGEMKQNLTNLVEEGRMTEEQYEQYQEQLMRQFGFYPILWYEKGFVFDPNLEQLGENNYTLTIIITPSEKFGGVSQQQTREINFSHLIKQVPTTPVISTETTAEEVFVNINWGNSDGNRIYTGEEVYSKMDDSYEEEVEAYVEESNLFYESEHVTETIQVPALVYAPEPTFNWAEQSLTMSAVCENHEVVLKLDGEEISNPYTVEQTEEEQTITFTAYTVAGQGEDLDSAEIESEEVIVPPAENYGDDPEEPTNEPR